MLKNLVGLSKLSLIKVLFDYNLFVVILLYISELFCSDRSSVLPEVSWMNTIV